MDEWSSRHAAMAPVNPQIACAMRLRRRGLGVPNARAPARSATPSTQLQSVHKQMHGCPYKG